MLASPDTPADPQAAAETPRAADPDTAILGEPLVVNGEKISLAEIKRHTVLMSTGRALYELAKIQVYIDQEIQRQVEQEGKTAADFDVSQEELDAAVARAHATIKEQYKDQADVTLEDFYPTQDPAWLEQVKQTKLFKKVFLPDNPHNYPPTTVAAFDTKAEGQQVIQVLQDDWDKTHAEGVEPPDVNSADPGQRVFEMMLTQQVLRHLNETADVRELEQGIPVHLLGIANGVEISVDEIWNQVRDSISQDDVWKAKQWLVVTTLLRQSLEESGFLISPEEIAAIWEEQAAPYRDSFFSLEKMALSIKKFPTLGMYKTYHRLYESYLRQIAEEMTDDVLNKQGRDRTAAIVSLSTADVDIILLPAYDFVAKKWIDDGWNKAAAQAKEVSQKLAAGADWSTLLDEYSGFVDPPTPTAQKDNQDYIQGLFNKGRFRGWVRNRLSTKLDEPEFMLFLNSNSITDYIFFEQEVGTIENPIRGPYGYYIPRLLHRSAPTKSLSANDSKSRPYLEQDYAAMRLRQRAQELLAKKEVKGF